MADSSQPWTADRTVTDGQGTLARWAPALTPTARQALALATVAAAGSWLGFYLITDAPFLDPETFRATIVFHAVTAVVFVPYLASLVLTRRLPGGSVLDLPLLALVAVYLLTTATSLDWRLSLEVTATALMGMGVFYVLSDTWLLRRWQVELALMLAALAAALNAIWVVGGDYLDDLRLANAVLGGLSFGDLVPDAVPKVHDVGDHPNILGGVLATSVPFFVVGIFRPVKAPLRALAALGGGAVLLAAFLTLARSAWLAAACGSLTAVALLAVATPEGRAFLLRLWPATARRRWLLAGAAVAVLAVAVVGTLLVFRSVEARPTWLFRASDDPRWDVMEAGVDMVRDYPLLGTGPGVYSTLYPEYSGLHPNHAFHSHNGFLQAAVDMGVAGMLVVLGLMVALGWLLIRGLRETDGPARLSLIACVGALVAFGTFSLFDTPNGFKSTLVVLAAVGAVAVLSTRECSPAAARRLNLAQAAPLVARLAAPVFMAGLLITWSRLDAGHYYYSNALANANVQHWPQAVDQAERAVELDPWFAVYRLELGTIHGQAYLLNRDFAALTDQDIAYLGNATRQLERTLEIEPRSAIAHANLASLLADASQAPNEDVAAVAREALDSDYGEPRLALKQETRAEALAALEFDNSDPAVALVAATALETANWGEEAVDAYARALSLEPSIADSPFWSETAFRRLRFAEIVRRSPLAYNQCSLLRLATMDAPTGPRTREEAFETCAQRVSANPGDLGARTTLAGALIDEAETSLDDGNQDEAAASLALAKAHLDYVLARQPDNGPARTALGRWHAAQGDLAGARGQWLRAGELGEIEALVLLGDSYPPGEVPAEVVQMLRSEVGEAELHFHLVGILYYRFKFYRASPFAILLPGDWQEAVPGEHARGQEALARWTDEAHAP